MQRGPFERHGETTAQVKQVELQAMGVGDHGQAGQGAFAGFGLEDGVHWRELLKLDAERAFVR